VVSLSVKTDPHSFVGLLGVDQSVQLLRSGNDLSHEHILDNLSNFSSNELVTLTNANINTDESLGELNTMYKTLYLANTYIHPGVGKIGSMDTCSPTVLSVEKPDHSPKAGKLHLILTVLCFC